MLVLATMMAAVQVSNPFSGWPVQLAIAAPFIVGIAFIGRWLIKRYDQTEQEKKDLYEKVLNDFLKAINSSNSAIIANTEALEETVGVVRDVRQELALERSLRVRYEERLRALGKLNPRGEEDNEIASP